MYVPSESISTESEENISVMVFLAVDLDTGRYTLAYPFLQLAAAKHSVLTTHIHLCTVHSVLCTYNTVHSGVGHIVSLWLSIVHCTMITGSTMPLP